MRTIDSRKPRGVSHIRPIGRRSQLIAQTMALALIIAACITPGEGPALSAPPSPTPASVGATAQASTAAPTATATATPTAVPTTTAAATPSGQASPESLVYPIADGEEWILFDGVAADPGEPGPHDALYLVRPDGTGLHRLVYQMNGSEIRATWSPDGSQVAYIQTRWPLDGGPGAGIWVVSADGTDPHRVYECAACDYLDWAADGAIYVGTASNAPDPDSPPLTFEIWRIDPASGDARAVLTREDGEMTVEQPRVSPDGTQLVYARFRIVDDTSAILIADMAGGAEQQLTDWELNASYPDWSVDGLISFNTNDLRIRPDQPHWVYTVRPDGTGLRRIKTHDPDAPDVEVQAGHARWTPNGTAMTFSLLLRGQAYLALMNADDSDQRLVPGPVWGTFSELRPVTD
jgi:hypothetical protein